MPRVLVYEPIDPTGESLEWLASHGLDLVKGPPMWQSPYHPFDERELIRQADGCIGLMGGGPTSIGRQVMEALPRLQYISKCGIGYDSIDVVEATRRGILVTNTPVHSEVEIVAEHTIALMLVLARKLNRVAGRISPQLLEEIGYPYKPFDRRHTPNSNWPRISGLRVLNGSTLGIIGVGEIGREIAIRAAAFNMRILYYQRTRLPADEERELKAAYVPLETLLAQSDWVVPQLPGGPETSGFLDRERLAQVKPGAFLVNISRAELVDRTALIEVLKSERLGGFALDPL